MGALDEIKKRTGVKSGGASIASSKIVQMQNSTVDYKIKNSKLVNLKLQSSQPKGFSAFGDNAAPFFNQVEHRYDGLKAMKATNTPILTGYYSGQVLDTNLGKTKGANSQKTDIAKLKAEYDQAGEDYFVLKYANQNNPEMIYNDDYKKQLKAAEDYYLQTEKKYNEAVKNNSAIDQADAITALESVKTSGKERKAKTGYFVDDFVPPGEGSDFETLARKGRSEKVGIFSDLFMYDQYTNKRATPDIDYTPDYLYMTEDEKNIYAYYYVKDGRKKANEYLTALDPVLNNRKQTDISYYTQKRSADQPLYGVVENLKGSFKTPDALVATAAHALKEGITGEVTPVDTNSPWFSGVHKVEDTAAGLKSNVESPLGQFAIDLGLSMGQFVTKLPFGPLALPLMASGAGGQTAYEVLKRDGSTGQALASGFVAAGIEYITERISLKSLLSLSRAGSIGYKNAFQAAAANIAKQSGTEAFEELTAEYLNTISDEVIMGNKSKMQTYIKQLEAEGVTEEEAYRKAFVQYYITNPLIAAGGGAISGGFMGGAGTAVSLTSKNNSDSQTGVELINSWGQNYSNEVNKLISEGHKYAEGTSSRAVADKLAEALDAGEQLSTKDIGLLYRAVTNAQQKETEAYFKSNTANGIMRTDGNGNTILPTAKELNAWNLRQEQNKYAEQLASVLRKYNVKNVVVEDLPEGEMGRWENGVVYVSSKLTTAEAINTKVAHEISHAAQESDAAFTDDLIDTMREFGMNVDVSIANKKKTYTDFYVKQGKSAQWIRETVTDAYAADEVTADFIGELMRNDDLVKSLDTRPTLIQRIIEAIRKLLQRNKSASERAAYTRLAQKLRSIAGTAGNAETRTGLQYADARLSIKNTRVMPWKTQIQEYFNNSGAVKSSDSLYLGETEKALSDVGIPAAPLYIPTSVINKAIRNKDGSASAHSMDINTIYKLQDAIDTAPAIVYNPSRNAVIYLTSLKDHGQFVMVSADLNNNLFGENAHRVTSIHGRDSMQGLLENLNKDAVIIIKNKNKLNDMLPGTEIQSLQLLASVEFANQNISQGDSEVKRVPRLSVEEGAKEPWAETEIQAKEAGYPVIDGKQVFPYKTWVRDKERGNYGLVVGLGGQTQNNLMVSFWNKEQNARAKIEIPAQQLELVTGNYQPSDIELTSLFQSEPVDSLRGAVSEKDWLEYRGVWDEALGFKPGTVVSLKAEDLPVKAQNYLTRSENGLARKIAKLMDVPVQAKREFLKPIVKEISQEYLNTGGVSDATIENLFEQAWEQGVSINDEFYNEYKDLKDDLKNTSVSISEKDKQNIADFDSWRRHQLSRIKLVTEGGVPIDVRYQELAESYPGLFPESITHPADQLRHMAEVSGSITKVEQSLNDYYGGQAEFMKEAAKHEFETAMMNYLPELKTVRKYYEQKARDEAERESTLAFAGMKLSDTNVESIKKLWSESKAAKKKVEKAVAKNLMTDFDNSVVDKLLSGELTLDTLPENANVKGVKAVYEAKADYEQLVGVIRKFNQNRKAALRHEADGFLKDALNWKDKKAGFLYMRETMERNIYDIVKDKETADGIIERYFEPIHKNEAQRTKLKNEFREKVKALELSRKVEKGNEISEAAAVQIYGEALDNIGAIEAQLSKKNGEDWRNGHTLTEWKSIVEDMMKNNPNLDMQKIKESVEEFRDIYNELFEKMNEARIRNGYEPVDYRRGYFPHFKDEQNVGDEKNILKEFGKSLGITIDVVDLPTSINGLTHTFRPGIRWQGSALERKGYDTVYDAVEGFDRYIEGVSDVIFHTDDIQSLRAFSEQIRYRSTDEGIREQIDAVRANKALSLEQKEKEIAGIYEGARFELSKFVKNLDEYTNLLANKKSSLDRMIEDLADRKWYNWMKWLEDQVGANMVAVNPGSWITNFIPLTQGGAQLKPKELLTAMWDTLKAYKTDDGFAEQSTFLTNRRGSDPLVQTWRQKSSGTLSKPMQYIDTFVSDSLVRARYQQNLSKGLSEVQSMDEADRWTAGVVADRSKGSLPTFFESRNPIIKAVTQFQLEVNNQMSYLFKDIPRDQKEHGGKALTVALLKFFFGAWLFNELYEYLVGRRPALDPIGLLNDSVGDFTGYELPNTFEALTDLVRGEPIKFAAEKKTLAGAEENLGKNVVKQLPFIGGVLGGGRLPITNALPDTTRLNSARANLISGEGSARKNWSIIADELSNPVAYVAMPFGGGQLRKMYQGIRAVIESGRYGIDSKGNDLLQYPVFNDNPLKTGLNVLQAGIFGPTSLKTGQEWVESGFKSFGAEQTAVYKELVANGTPERTAYNIIADISKAEAKNKGTRNEIPKTVVQRNLLLNSELTALEKDAVYYGLIATDKERVIMEKLDDVGAKYGTVSATLAAIQNVESTPEVHANVEHLSSAEQKRNILMKADLTDEQKRVIYEAMISDSESTTKRIDTCIEAGLGFNNFLEISNTFSTIDDDDSMKFTEKAIQFIADLDAKGYNTSQIANVGQSFLFRASMANVNTLASFVELTDAGMSGTNAAKALDTIDDLEPLAGKDQVSDIQKMRAVADMPFSESDKLATMKTVLDEYTFAKVQIASDYGVKVKSFVSFKEILPKYDADKSGSYKQAEVENALNNMKGLSNDQKAALWQLQTGGKNNPYNSSIGANIKAKLADQKETSSALSALGSSGGGALGKLKSGVGSSGGTASQSSTSNTDGGSALDKLKAKVGK